jgi:deoxyuridine 5'-triphosphate nucleotidohydrolase
MANGVEFRPLGMVKNVLIKIGHVETYIDAEIFDQAHYPLLLGNPTFRTLPIATDWEMGKWTIKGKEFAVDSKNTLIWHNEEKFVNNQEDDDDHDEETATKEYTLDTAMVEIKFEKVDDRAILLMRAYNHNAAYDLSALDDTMIINHQPTAVRTGVRAFLPPSLCGMIVVCSSLAKNHGIFVMGRLIDPGYMGELMALLCTTKKEPVHLKEGDKVAQFLPLPCVANYNQKQEHKGKTQHSEKGFGSSDSVYLMMVAEVVDKMDIDQEKKETLVKRLEGAMEMFADTLTELSIAKNIVHHIPTGNARPIKCKPY